ncbi:hypothetical protein A3D03_06165 [Candidatus Gottesmanbacteria bacterium RIFCSPHIGHO2_02_FULL_40_13]|uniref:Bacterial type II secretion system protein E domain-containing protein n=1 Tax=Candidatus Gottesmanbacteria bacterium RIFCSPHIGHO2_02_FULL_40_13 TaxID=1798384 RepID=A0A1F6A6P3_9BACT|nr:MAG: hypothetical protein A3D03_06165 [Candidatus Gottesmanbacteria bacterium RIFCSPHIGHO2_02_FULL_40_13]
MNINQLLETAVFRKASDLHILADQVPVLRINGELVFLVSFPKLKKGNIEEMIFSLINSQQKEVLLANKELDFSTVLELENKNTVRFRANAYFSQGAIFGSFRVISTVIKSIEDLNLPPIVKEFAKLRQGLILVTGPTGQGKSTTLSSIIQEINLSRTAHIISIEDPIEYIYPKGQSIISQREMYQDTHSWSSALKNIFREDPDVIYIGEMRDRETISSVLTIAETGHLVLATLHTNSASQTIDRIIDIFPADERDQSRMQLSMVLSAIMTQKLVPAIAGGRLPVCEILLGTASIRNNIRDGKTHLIDNIIQTSSDEGMMIFEEHLRQRVHQNKILHEIALEYAIRPDIYLELIKS